MHSVNHPVQNQSQERSPANLAAASQQVSRTAPLHKKIASTSVKVITVALKILMTGIYSTLLLGLTPLALGAFLTHAGIKYIELRDLNDVKAIYIRTMNLFCSSLLLPIDGNDLCSSNKEIASQGSNWISLASLLDGNILGTYKLQPLGVCDAVLYTQSSYSANRDLASKKIIVKFNGNSEIGGISHGLLQDVLGGINCVTFDYPFMKGQKYSTAQDLVSRGEEIVQSLLDQGYQAENILLYGFSLGGGVAASVAKKMSENHKGLNLCLRNTFTNWFDVVGASVNNLTFSYIGKLVEVCLKTFAASYALNPVESLRPRLASTQQSLGYGRIAIVNANHDQEIQSATRLAKSRFIVQKAKEFKTAIVNIGEVGSWWSPEPLLFFQVETTKEESYGYGDKDYYRDEFRPALHMNWLSK